MMRIFSSHSYLFDFFKEDNYDIDALIWRIDLSDKENKEKVENQEIIFIVNLYFFCFYSSDIGFIIFIIFTSFFP